MLDSIWNKKDVPVTPGREALRLAAACRDDDVRGFETPLIKIGQSAEGRANTDESVDAHYKSGSLAFTAISPPAHRRCHHVRSVTVGVYNFRAPGGRGMGRYPVPRPHALGVDLYNVEMALSQHRRIVRISEAYYGDVQAATGLSAGKVQCVEICTSYLTRWPRLSQMGHGTGTGHARPLQQRSAGPCASSDCAYAVRSCRHCAGSYQRIDCCDE